MPSNTFRLLHTLSRTFDTMEIAGLNTSKWITTSIKQRNKIVMLNEIAIYESLRVAGLRVTNVDGKGCFYFRHKALSVTNLTALGDVVWETLEQIEDPKKELAKAAFLNKNPIRNGDRMKHILRDKLTSHELHEIRRQTNPHYCKQTEIKETIETLTKLGFQKTSDQAGDFGGSDIYFKNVHGQEFIVLNHFGKQKSIDKQGFDCWKTQFAMESDIGKTKPLSVHPLQLCFHLDRDMQLIC